MAGTNPTTKASINTHTILCIALLLAYLFQRANLSTVKARFRAPSSVYAYFRLSVAVRHYAIGLPGSRAKVPLNRNSLKYNMIFACSRGLPDFLVPLERRHLGLLFTKIITWDGHAGADCRISEAQLGWVYWHNCEYPLPKSNRSRHLQRKRRSRVPCMQFSGIRESSPYCCKRFRHVRWPVLDSSRCRRSASVTCK